MTRNQSGKRKVIVIVRERGGNSVPAVFNSESQAASFIRARIAKGTVLHADEAALWDNLHERFEVKRISHQEAYSLDGACTNMAEEYFSRLRRAEIGIHHHIAGSYLLRYAQVCTPTWFNGNGNAPLINYLNQSVSQTSATQTNGRNTGFLDGAANIFNNISRRHISNFHPGSTAVPFSYHQCLLRGAAGIFDCQHHRWCQRIYES